MAEKQENLERCLAFCAVKGVTERGMDIVREVISNPPARRVSSRSMSPNLTCRFPSRKMGLTIQAESRSLELSSIYLKEFDDDVLAYWDQPAHRPSLKYKSGSRAVRVPVTLDFFVISEGFIGFEECKPLEQLKKLSAKTPGRYLFDEAAGEYVIPPLAAYLEGTGLSHRVTSEQHIDSTYVENLALLYDLLDEPISSGDRQHWADIKCMLDVKGGLSIGQIEASVSSVTRMSLMAAIVHKVLFVDLYTQCLSEPERVMVYADAHVVAENTHVVEKLEVATELPIGSAKEITEAMLRFKLIESLLGGADIKLVAAQAEVSVRTVQRWLSQYRSDGMQGLQPKNANKGNKGSKLPEAVEECIADVIEEYYMDDRARKRFHVHQLLRSRCKQLGYQPPSRQAFYARLQSLSDRSVLKIREGAKRAYQVTGYEGVEGEGGEHAFRNVSRYLERCHIDHTQADIQLVSSEGGHLGKPWLTLIIDEYTGFILSAYLSFRNPGVAALMSAIRLMVKCHGVFPESVVVDGGKEFESVYFETLMATYRCSIVSRKGKPRAGSAVERIFGTINTVFLDNLAGNNKLAKNIRQLSDSHNPKKLAVWEAVDFYHALLAFIDEWNNKSKKSSGLSPAALKDISLERFGLRGARNVSFNRQFLEQILPAPKRPTVRLRKNKKIQVNRVTYWHGCLRAMPAEGVTADVRYDPFDLNYVYVYYKKEWLKFKAARPQHRNLDDLDAAIVAEVARQSLVVNEASKAQGRMEMAVAVEAMGEQVSRHVEIVDKFEADNIVEMEFADSYLDIEEVDEDDNIWVVAIPESVEKN